MANEPNPSNTTAIPEKITLGDTEYVVKDNPELMALFNSALQKARKEEKDKLYKESSELKDLVKTLEPFKKQAEEAQTELEKFRSETADKIKELEDKSKSQNSKDTMSDKTFTQEELDARIADATKKAIEDAKAAALKEVEDKYSTKFTEIETSLKGKIVSDYKERLIAANKDIIIPDFLSGSTPEELDESLKSAIEKSKPYLTVDYKGKKVTLAEKEVLDAKAAEEAEKKKNMPPVNYPNPPGQNPLPPAGESLLKNVKDMSPEEYAQNRAAIIRETKNYQE